MISSLRINIYSFFTFLKDILKSYRLIFDLTKKDLKVRYLGSYLGVLWAFIQPAFSILIMWFVFQVGFKSQNVANIPFILWLSCGMIPWFFLSDGISGGSSSIIENSFLVKKVVFRVSVLPIVKILSSVFLHLFFIAILMGMFLFYGYMPDVLWLEIIYYLFASFVLLTGIAFISSSVIIFFKDFGQIVGMILQLLFWITPIFWSMDIVPKQYQLLLKINPILYLINGYRDAFIYKTGFWNHPVAFALFWVEALCFFIAGAVIFKRLRSHFADVI